MSNSITEGDSYEGVQTQMADDDPKQQPGVGGGRGVFGRLLVQAIPPLLVICIVTVSGGVLHLIRFNDKYTDDQEDIDLRFESVEKDYTNRIQQVRTSFDYEFKAIAGEVRRNKDQFLKFRDSGGRYTAERGVAAEARITALEKEKERDRKYIRQLEAGHSELRERVTTYQSLTKQRDAGQESSIAKLWNKVDLLLDRIRGVSNANQ